MRHAQQHGLRAQHTEHVQQLVYAHTQYDIMCSCQMNTTLLEWLACLLLHQLQVKLGSCSILMEVFWLTVADRQQKDARHAGKLGALSKSRNIYLCFFICVVGLGCVADQLACRRLLGCWSNCFLEICLDGVAAGQQLLAVDGGTLSLMH